VNYVVKKLIICFLTFFLLAVSAAAQGDEVRFIDVDQYLAAKDNVILIDVRSVKSRSLSRQEIPGEIWLNPKNDEALDSFLATADHEQSYVVFCSCPEDKYSIQMAKVLTCHNFAKVFVLKDGWDALRRETDIEKASIK
jgi:rhodanese-related sulfurtransferase